MSARTCSICGADLAGMRQDATYCGPACRREAARRRLTTSEAGPRVQTSTNGSGPQRRANRVALVRALGGSQLDLTERIAGAIETADPNSGLTYLELAEIAYSAKEPTTTQLSAVRRSVARLVTDGRAMRGRRRHVWGRWGRGGIPVEIHRPLTAAEREAKAERAERLAKQISGRGAAVG